MVFGKTNKIRPKPKSHCKYFGKLVIDKLGHNTFYAQGGDWGSSITEQIALQYEKHVAGIHLTDVPFQHLFTVRKENLSAAEKAYLEKGKEWQMTEGGYAMIQGTKPQTLGYALNDSPAGLAAWIIKKFKTWSDCNGISESIFQKINYPPILLFTGLHKRSILLSAYIMKLCIILH